MDLLASLVNMALLASAVRLTVPILLTALGAVYTERGGVFNIGLEGTMIMGTFFGAAVTHLVTQAFQGPEASAAAPAIAPVTGMLAAMVAGVLFSSIHAVMAVTFRVDQLISGVALNLLAVGLARFLNILFFGVATQSPGIRGFGPWSIPLLREVPALAPVATGISPMIPIALGLVVLGQWILLRTVFGLRLRAVGENPHAADTLGVNVVRLRYAGVLISGALAGLAGGYLSIEQGRGYLEGMTQGRGFIALAAMIFGNWWPLGALGASALFGYFDALSLRVVYTGVPYQFITVLPHLATILVLAGFVRRATPPAADGIPFTKEEG
ncbi:MAG: ABC transporter permease [Armatimonadota bacterium]|nr:ABC transporter permease [Armatimonadota bacterium]MDR7518187.1 ABC transporter permease [Armatimonadota bacterium]MDR7548441.1 ABC transporter permease [Armatimonadota bacterium]